MSKTERQKYKIAGPATWELIRAAYLGGESATTLAERFGVGVHGIRKRITVEGWTKRDYAAALEARGVIREKAKPNFIEEGVLREELRVAAEAREAVEREAEMNALVEQIASEEDASGIAAAIERRALAQASAAMVQGRTREAQALASMAEQMRRRVGPVAATPLVVQRGAEMTAHSPAELERRALAQAGEALARGDAAEAKALTAVAEQMRKRMDDAREAERAEVERVEIDEAQREEAYMMLFNHAAIVAGAMVHSPNTAPGVFLRMIKRWRQINLGEGAADAEARAAVIAAAQQRYFEGRERENLPEDVRAYVEARWRETCARLDRDEPVGVVKWTREPVGTDAQEA